MANERVSQASPYDFYYGVTNRDSAMVNLAGFVLGYYLGGKK
jgi:hypothetical protein